MQTGASNTAALSASDPNGDSLTYTWLILPLPSGGPTDHTTYAPVPWGEGTGMTAGTIPGLTFVAPVAPGPYRLTVWVSDGKGYSAYAQCAFYVSPAPAPVALKTNADTMTTDGKALAAGYFGGVNAYGTLVETTIMNNGSSTQIQTQVSYAPVSAQSTTALAGVGGNNFAYFGFTVPAGLLASGFGTPSRVILNVFAQKGSPLTLMTGVNVYAVPYTWTENNLNYLNSPCNVPTTSTALTYGQGGGTQMPGAETPRRAPSPTAPCPSRS